LPRHVVATPATSGRDAIDRPASCMIDPPASPPPRDAAPLRYLALGDSYPIGEGIDPVGRWPMQLARALRGEGIRLADPQVVAATGWTTDELSTAFDAATPTGTFALVSLLIGVNNQYRGRSVAEFHAQLDALLARATGFAGGRAGRVLVLAIPDWGVTPFAVQSGRDRDAIA